MPIPVLASPATSPVWFHYSIPAQDGGTREAEAEAVASGSRPAADLGSESPHDRLRPARSRIDLPRWWRRDQFHGMPQTLRESCDAWGRGRGCSPSLSSLPAPAPKKYLLPQTASWELELAEKAPARRIRGSPKLPGGAAAWWRGGGLFAAR